jgi:predicted small lipoprotein YifL
MANLWRGFVAIFLMSALSGCGGSSKAPITTPTQPKTQDVPAGTYSLLITANNGATAHSVPVKVVVQ